MCLTNYIANSVYVFKQILRFSFTSNLRACGTVLYKLQVPVVTKMIWCRQRTHIMHRKCTIDTLAFYFLLLKKLLWFQWWSFLKLHWIVRNAIRQYRTGHDAELIENNLRLIDYFRYQKFSKKFLIITSIRYVRNKWNITLLYIYHQTLITINNKIICI